MRLRTKLLSIGAVVVGTATMAFAGAASGGNAATNTQGDQSPQAKQIREAKTGPRTRMPDGPPTVMVFWGNGEFHTVTLPPMKVFETANGGEIQQLGDASTPAMIESQLPPVNHALDKVQPTPAQASAAIAANNAAQKALDATDAAAKGKAAATQEGPSRPPAGSESTSPGPASS